MLSRRNFLGTVGLGAASRFSRSNAKHRKLAVVTTEWRFRSHAWHMGERFLGGYPIKGRWHAPPLDVVSAYVDQFRPFLAGCCQAILGVDGEAARSLARQMDDHAITDAVGVVIAELHDRAARGIGGQ